MVFVDLILEPSTPTTLPVKERTKPDATAEQLISMLGELEFCVLLEANLLKYLSRNVKTHILLKVK